MFEFEHTLNFSGLIEMLATEQLDGLHCIHSLELYFFPQIKTINYKIQMNIQFRLKIACVEKALFCNY